MIKDKIKKPTINIPVAPRPNILTDEYRQQAQNKGGVNPQQQQQIAEQMRTEANANVQREVQQPVVQPTPQQEQPKAMTYQDMLDYLKKDDEEIEKKAARNRMIAGVGDAISAIANLAAVNKGAENAYTPALSNAYQKYYDKLKAERDADKALMMNYYYKNVENEMARDAAAREQANKDREYQLAKDKAEAERKDKAAQRELDKMRAQIDKDYKEGVLGVQKDLAEGKKKVYSAQALKIYKDEKNKDIKLKVMDKTVDIPEEVWNSTNIERIFNVVKLTEEEKKGSKTIKDKGGYLGGTETTYKPYTLDEKKQIIGRHLDEPAVAKEIFDILGIDNDIVLGPTLLPTDEDEEESEYGGSLLN